VTNTPSTAPYTTPTTTARDLAHVVDASSTSKTSRTGCRPGATVGAVTGTGDRGWRLADVRSGSTDISEGEAGPGQRGGELTRTFPGHMVRAKATTDADRFQKTKNLNKDNWDSRQGEHEVVRYLVGKGVDPKRSTRGLQHV